MACINKWCFAILYFCGIFKLANFDNRNCRYASKISAGTKPTIPAQNNLALYIGNTVEPDRQGFNGSKNSSRFLYNNLLI